MFGQPIQRSSSEHRPLHLYANEAFYWITAATLYHKRYLTCVASKSNFVSELYASAETWQVEVIAWTLMDDHWQRMIKVEDGRNLSRFLGRLHSGSSRFVNERDGALGRHVWHQYWDTFLNTEGHFWSRINYTWWNPVRHGYCASPEEWRWTNLHALMSEADETARDALARFPAPRKLPRDLL
jgi:putative transposase